MYLTLEDTNIKPIIICMLAHHLLQIEKASTARLATKLPNKRPTNTQHHHLERKQIKQVTEFRNVLGVSRSSRLTPTSQRTSIYHSPKSERESIFFSFLAIMASDIEDLVQKSCSQIWFGDGVVGNRRRSNRKLSYHSWLPSLSPFFVDRSHEWLCWTKEPYLVETNIQKMRCKRILRKDFGSWEMADEELGAGSQTHLPPSMTQFINNEDAYLFYYIILPIYINMRTPRAVARTCHSLSWRTRWKSTESSPETRRLKHVRSSLTTSKPPITRGTDEHGIANNPSSHGRCTGRSTSPRISRRLIVSSVHDGLNLSRTWAVCLMW